MADETLVFVYGTLKKNEPNHHYMTSAKFVCEATSVEKFPLVIASKYNIPFTICKPGVGNNIKGEVYRVDDKTFVELDELEQYPVLYNRLLQDFVTSEGSVVRAWIYLLEKYQPEMLMLPFYESYHSEGSHGKRYIASEDDLKKPEDI